VHRAELSKGASHHHEARRPKTIGMLRDVIVSENAAGVEESAEACESKYAGLWKFQICPNPDAKLLFLSLEFSELFSLQEETLLTL